jgi:hypothetical protein
MPTHQIQTFQGDSAQHWLRKTTRTRSTSYHMHPGNSKKMIKNYTPFLLKMAATAWGMDNLNKYLKGSKFTLYMDRTPEQNLGTTQVKTLNRLKTATSEHNFDTRNRQKSNIPDFLKKTQTNTR